VTETPGKHLLNCSENCA